MCFFFSCTPYFKGACNQLRFGLILKSKGQLYISDNFNTLFLHLFMDSFLKQIRVQRAKCIRKHLEPSYFHMKSPNLKGCVIEELMPTS